MNFVQALYERIHIITVSFAERPLKQSCLAYRDCETTLLTFKIMKLKIDAHSIFIIVLSEKKLSSPSFLKHFVYSAVE